LRKEEEKRKQREAEERKQKAREEKERLERERKEKEEKIRREKEEKMRKEKEERERMERERKEKEEREKEAREIEAKEQEEKKRKESEAKEEEAKEAKEKAIALEREREAEREKTWQAQLTQQNLQGSVAQTLAAATNSSTSSPSIQANQMPINQRLPAQSIPVPLSLQYPPVQFSGPLYPNPQSNPNLRQPSIPLPQPQSVMTQGRTLSGVMNPMVFGSQQNALQQPPSPIKQSMADATSLLSQPSFPLSQQSLQHSLSSLGFAAGSSPSSELQPHSNLFNPGAGLPRLRLGPPGIVGHTDSSSTHMQVSGSSASNTAASPSDTATQAASFDSSATASSNSLNAVPPGIGAGRNAPIGSSSKAISRPAPIGRPHFGGIGPSIHSTNPLNYEDSYAGVFGPFGTGAATNSGVLSSTLEPDEQFAASALGADLFKDAWLAPSSNTATGSGSGSGGYPQIAGGMGVGMGGPGIVGQSRFVGGGATQQGQNQPNSLGVGAVGGFLGFQPAQDSRSRGLFDSMGMWSDAPGLSSMGGVGIGGGMGGGMGGLMGDLGAPVGGGRNSASNDVIGGGFGFPSSGSGNFLVPGAGAGAPSLGGNSHQDLGDGFHGGRQPPGPIGAGVIGQPHQSQQQQQQGPFGQAAVNNGWTGRKCIDFNVYHQKRFVSANHNVCF
jgi:hypothetical protein